MQKIRKMVYKNINKSIYLVLYYLKYSIDSLEHRSQDDLKRFSEGDICQLICQIEKDLAKCAVVFVLSLLQRKQHVSGKDDCHMCCQCIIRQTVALTDQVQIRLAGLEEHLDLPAFSINPNDLFFGKIRIGADKCDPVQDF